MIKAVVPPQYLDDKTIYHLQPSGRFVIGGPQVTSNAHMETHKHTMTFCFFSSVFTCNCHTGSNIFHFRALTFLTSDEYRQYHATADMMMMRMTMRMMMKITR